MEKTLTRPTEKKAIAHADDLIGPGIRTGALRVLQNLPYMKAGKPFEHVFNSELGEAEQGFIRGRIYRGDRAANVIFEFIEKDGDPATRVVVVKGRR